MTQKQELELSQQREQRRTLQEQLLQAESSLDLYQQKFQAALGRAGELEGQVQRLQVEATSQVRGARGGGWVGGCCRERL